MGSNKSKSGIDTNTAWNLLFDKYNIIDEVEQNGMFIIQSDQIKTDGKREPRLMTKWDSNEQLPAALKDNHLNILPNSGSSYVISDFMLYEPLPLTNVKTSTISYDFSNYETIDMAHIQSESIAIDIMGLTKMLEDFLQTPENIETFDGKSSSGAFDFTVNGVNGRRKVSVNNARIEIDAGFENEESIVILEAKNVIHDDFLVRQLYYPFRKWNKKVRKPIRLVFLLYSNQTFKLFEYRFNDIYDYSSIALVQSKGYVLEDKGISLDDLIYVRKQTRVLHSDSIDTQNNTTSTAAPFIQANSFDRVISLLEHLYHHPMTDAEIADLMGFGQSISPSGHITYRQSQYYYNAGKYLGLFEKYKDDNKGTVIKLTKLGRSVYEMDYKQRQLKLVSLILQHQIFAELFDFYFDHDRTIPDLDVIEQEMKLLRVCNAGQISRRAGSVKQWLNWIFSLIN